MDRVLRVMRHFIFQFARPDAPYNQRRLRLVEYGFGAVMEVLEGKVNIFDRAGNGELQMSRIVTTKLGRFRAVTDGAKKWWLWECPNCKTWNNLSIDQMEGRVSVHCASPKQYHYPTSVRACGYHETHEFAKELATTIQARMVMGEEPFEEDTDGPKPQLFEERDGNFIPYLP